jgi:hypothetical protein
MNMVNKDLLDFVEGRRKAGYPDFRIKDELRKVGWKDSDITEAFQNNNLTAMSNTAHMQQENQKAIIPQKTNSTLFIVIICILVGGLFFASVFIVPIIFSYGVLEPSKLLPERCQSSVGMDCIDKAAIAETTVIFALRNNLGVPITVDSVVSSKCTNPSEISIATNQILMPLPGEVKNNDIFRIKLNGCKNGRSGGKFDDRDITLTYTDSESKDSKEIKVDIRGKVN